jgi:hypothetical protein
LQLSLPAPAQGVSKYGFPLGVHIEADTQGISRNALQQSATYQFVQAGQLVTSLLFILPRQAPQSIEFAQT